MLTDIGITLCKELDYSSDRLAEYRGKKGNHKVKFKYNPEHMGFIWVIDEDQEEYFKVPAIEYEYASTVSLWQHKINLEIKEKLNNSDYNEDEEIDTEIAIEEIVHESIRKKKTSITNKKRAARYLEHSERAKSQKNNDIVLDEKKSPSSIETDVDDDSDWDIDYV
uniref:Mu transposase C-terminal domain-containing protein n=1 Tax=Photobacterium obscurum TaxID=2829490 RepID=UPI00389AE5B0